MYLSPDEPDYELDTAYWCTDYGAQTDPYEAFDLSKFPPAQTRIDRAPCAKTLKDIYQISITAAGNCPDPIYRSAIDWTIETSGEGDFIQPFAKQLILLANEYFRKIPEPKINTKGGQHAQILTLWQYYSGYDYWGEHDENFTLLGLLEPCETGTHFTSVESILDSQRSNPAELSGQTDNKLVPT